MLHGNVPPYVRIVLHSLVELKTTSRRSVLVFLNSGCLLVREDTPNENECGLIKDSNAALDDNLMLALLNERSEQQPMVNCPIQCIVMRRTSSCSKNDHLHYRLQIQYGYKVYALDFAEILLER